MPITSTQVSNIIGGQVGMFSASAQYSQAISAQYGFQPHGAPFGMDPFQQQQQQQNLAMGGSVASGGIRGMHLGMGAMSTAAMFGAAPRIFDPFTSGASAFAGGMARGGLMGGMASGAMAFGGVSAAIGGLGWGINQMQTGAQNRQMITQQAGQMMPGMGVGGLNAVAGQIESMNRQGMGSLQELTGLMRQGANSGAVNTSSLNDFTMSFQKLVTNVKQVAQALNTTMSQAQQAMQQVKSMGISSDSAAGFLGTARAFGAQVGMGPQQMMQVAGMGSGFAANSGINRQLGAQGAITQAGVYGLANREGMAGVLPDSYQRYMGGASRFLSSTRGRSVLGAMLDVNNGGINMQVARQISAGGMSRTQINQLSRSNIAQFGRDEFEASRGEMGASFLSQFGPQGLGRTIGDMTSNSSNPQQLRRMLTGLTRADMVGMQNLQGQTQRLTQQLVNSAREGFREGQQNQTFTGALKQTWDQLVKPVKDQFRQIGADMTKSMQEAVGQFTGEFARADHSPGVTAASSRSAYQRHFRAATMGGDSAFLDMINSQGGGQRRLGFDLAPGGPGDDQSMMARLARRLPSAFRIGSYAQGTTWGDLPMGGLGTEEYSGTQSMALMGLRPGGHALGWGGRQMMAGGGWAARGIAENFPSSGPLGMGGRGFVGGSAMFGARATQGMGLLSRGVGGLARAAGPAGAIYDFATNQLPAARRRLGYDSIVAGAITGQQRDYTNLLMDTGTLGDGDFREMDVADFHKMSADDRNALTPVGGFSEGPGGSGGTMRGGRQRFLTQQGRERLIHLRDHTNQEQVRQRFSITDTVGTPQAAILAAADAVDGFGSMTDHERVNAITEQLHKDGHRRVRPSDVVMAGANMSTSNGVALFRSTDTTRAQFTSPGAVRSRTGKQLSREMSVHMMRAAAHGELNLNTLSGEARSTFARELHEALGSTGTNRILKDEYESTGDNSVIGEDGAIDLDKIPQGVAFADIFDSGSINSAGDHSSTLNAATNNMGHGSVTGGGRSRVRSTSGSTNAEVGGNALRKAWQAGMADLLVGSGDGTRSAVAAIVGRYNRASGDDATSMQNHAIAQLMQLTQASTDPALQQASTGTITGTSATASISRDDWANLLSRGDGGFGGALTAESDTSASNSYRSAILRRSGVWQDRNTNGLNMGIREAMEMSGGNSFSLGNMRDVMRRYYTGQGDSARQAGRRGGYSDSMDVAGRQHLMDSLQLRLRATDDVIPSGGAAAEIQAAREAGGQMNMRDLDRLGAELLEENDAGLQDMGQTVTNMARFRRAARTNDGMGRGRDQVQVAKNVLGLRLGGDSETEDKAYLRGETGSVMSLHLERQLRTMARGALASAAPGENITEQMISERVGRYTSALRADDAQATGYEELNRVINTLGAPTDPNSAAPAGRDGSNTAATMSTLSTQVQTFSDLVGNMNSAMSNAGFAQSVSN